MAHAYVSTDAVPSHAPVQTAVAAFDVFGRAGEDLPDLSALLGVEADTSHRRGEPSGTASGRWPTDYWSIREEVRIAVGEDFASAAESCLRRLLDRVKPLEVAAKLRRAGLLGNAQVAVFGFCADPRDTNIGYTAEVLKDLADLSVPLDEDIYINSASEATENEERTQRSQRIAGSDDGSVETDA